MHKTIKAIIFDLDGVIIDSNPEIEKFWHRWAATTGRSLTPQNIAEHIHGRKGVETLAALFDDINNDTKEAILADAIQFDSQMNPEPISGIHSFVNALCNIALPLGIVTSSHKERAVVMLEKQSLFNCFKVFVTAADVMKGKPHPEPYLTIAKKLDLLPEHCLVFEDAISGVQSAKAAGMEVIGINTPAAADNLMTNGATSVIANFNELRITQNKLMVENEVNYTLQAL